MTRPSHDHPAEHDEQAALYALDDLDGPERAAFEAHLLGCSRCRETVEQDRVTLARLSHAVAEMDPSTGFKERLLRKAAAERATLALPVGREREHEPPRETTPTPTPTPTPLPSRPSPGAPPTARRGAWPLARMLPLAAAAVLVLGALGVLAQQQYMNQVIASADLAGDAPVAGTATVLVRRNGTAELRLAGLAAPPSGGVYEAWIIGPDGTPRASGSAASGTAVVPLRGDVNGRTVAITVEASPDPLAPSTKPILLAVVRT